MANLLLISVAEWDTRVALVEDGRLAEFYLEPRGVTGPTGNIYKGRVAKVLPGMAAAFVEVGLGRPAYLFAEDVSAQEDEFFSLWLAGEAQEAAVAGAPPRTTAPPIDELLHEGQEILVQVLRGPMGGKGARLTTHITLAGHFLVYMPTFPHLGVSRRITEEGERQRLKGLLEELRPGEGGLIARTAGRGADRDRLAGERDGLVGQYQKIQRKKDGAPTPSLLHQEMDPVRRLVRELYTPEIHRVLVDDPQAHRQVLEYLGSLNSLDRHRVELYPGPDSIFAHFGVDLKWPRLLAPQVWLKSGGHLLFDRTEALTAIDVNTGRFVGRHHLEDTILQTNLEAAREIARQLRLRNVGGLIVIDFIDMEKAAHREQVHQELVQGLKKDRAKTTALPISALGLVEMTRQRLRGSLGQAVMEPCPCCDGQGGVVSPLVLAWDLLRLLNGEAREFKKCRLVVEANPQVGALVRKEGESLLRRLQEEHQVQVEMVDRPNFTPEKFEITHELL